MQFQTLHKTCLRVIPLQQYYHSAVTKSSTNKLIKDFYIFVNPVIYLGTHFAPELTQAGKSVLAEYYDMLYPTEHLRHEIQFIQ